MNISVIGIGYVGLVSAVCFAEMGHHVSCIDIDQSKINRLNEGQIPIYEIGLTELLEKNKDKISFTTDFSILEHTPDAVFVAVGTPQSDDGSAYMEYFYQAVISIAKHINRYVVIVNKSTVPIGTSEHVRSLINAQLQKQNKNISIDVVSNPEFLREGTSIKDFMEPDRIVVGVSSTKAREIMDEIYRPLTEQGYKIIFCDNRTAETIKYAANAFLAVKLSFINEISALCDSIGADVNKVAYGIGMDKRIGKAFLKAGPGYGGSCFPKDTQALCCMADAYSADLSIVKSAISANSHQKKRMCEKISNAMDGNINGKTIALLGLAFKKNTDDMRYSPALEIVDFLYQHGANIRAYDPAAMNNAKDNYFKNMDIYYAKDAYDTLKDAEALVIMTEWDEFKELDLVFVKKQMAGNIFIDLRNLYDRSDLEQAAFDYSCVGR